MTRGVLENQAVSTKLMRKDIRTSGEKFDAFIEKPEGLITILAGLICCAFIEPTSAFSEFFLFSSVLLTYYAKTRKFMLPFRMPQSGNVLDYKDPIPGSTAPGKSAGIAFLGNEKETKRELWFKNDDMRTHLLIFGSTGAGKALKKKELVLTNNGWIKNKDLKIGDKVLTPDGSYSPIIGIYPQGYLKVYDFVLSDGRSIEVSGDHLWGVYVNNEYLLRNTLDVKKLIENNISVHIPLTTHPFVIDKKVPIDSYLLGLLIANAYFDKNNLYFRINDINIFNEVKEYITNYFEIIPTDIENKVILRAFDNKLLEILSNLNVLKHNSNRFIPAIYKNASYNQKMSLLSGIFELASKDKNNKTYFTTRSLSLSKDLSKIIYSLGGTCETIKKMKSNKNYFEYVLNIQFQNYKDLYLSNIKRSGVVNNVITKTIAVVNVVETGKEEDCQCIKIANTNGLFITKNYIVTHNTETLLSIGYNALVQGSGLIYVDGKGENTLFIKIFSMARCMGRDDDVLLINYMTGSRDVFGPQESKLSNTLNPFISGSSGGLTELLVSLMDDSGGDNAMWKGRAISLISAIMMALVWMREQKEILLDVEIIREYMNLENIIKLSKRGDLPAHVKQSIRAYLKSLPGYQEGTNKQSETVMDQHGYLQMQFTKILGSLGDSYGYIFKTNLGEVDFWDVVVNRRILVVLLPALEKSQEELSNLGKIIVACLKQMMATGLGALVEGSYQDIVETKPTTSPTPFMCILDEYGYYAVKGAAVMPAQARSLGFCMIFAGQDYPAFEKASKEEAASTIANCNIKIFMKLEDPKDTFDLFIKSVGEEYIAKGGGYDKTPGAISTRLQESANIGFEKVSRGDLLDLKDQREGEAHIIFKSAVIRAQMFYAATPKAKHIQVNHLLRVEPPEKEEIFDMNENIKDFITKLTDSEYMEDILSLTDTTPEMNIVKKCFSDYEVSNLEIGPICLESLRKRVQANLEQFKKNIDEDSSDSKILQKINVFSTLEDDDDEVDYDDNDDDENNQPVFLNEDKTRNRFREIERLSGATAEEAELNTNRVIEDMKIVSEYPHGVTPDDKEPDDILDLIRELDEKNDED